MKYLFLLMIVTVLINCKSANHQTGKMQSNIEAYLKAHGQAGDDYKFIGITEIDTVTEKDFLERQMESLSLQLTNKDKRLRKMDSLEMVFKKGLEQHPNDQVLQQNLQDITRGKTTIYVMQHKLDSLTATAKPEQAQSIKFIGLDFSFSSKGGNGATVPHHYYVKLDEQMNVLSVSDLQQ
ncbi:MAG: hypothetical protein ABJB16_16265 [Saprospiraceae bacterium]